MFSSHGLTGLTCLMASKFGYQRNDVVIHVETFDSSSYLEGSAYFSVSDNQPLQESIHAVANGVKSSDFSGSPYLP